MGRLKYVMTIPSLDIHDAIETSDLVLVGSRDPRYLAACNDSPNLADYLSRFSSPFGRKLSPSIVLRDTLFPKVTAERLSSFRNAVAVSSVLESRVRSYIYQRAIGCFSTEMFEFYPVSLASDEKDLITRTVLEQGLANPISSFHGQSSPAVIYPQNLDFGYEKCLLEALVAFLDGRATTPDGRRFRSKVLLSLQFAYYALSTPFSHLGSAVDYGVALSLWVSAFESLAHPGDQDVTFSHVSSLIRSVPWFSARLRRSGYSAVGAKVAGKQTTLPVQSYGRLFQTRNKYLHGGKFPKGQFEYQQRKNRVPLQFQVPALYRCVLLSELAKQSYGAYDGIASGREYENLLAKKASDYSDA
jgi:hypothetical protein